MQVSAESEELGRFPLDEILGVVVTGFGCTHSSNLLVRLAELGITITFCGTNFMPVAISIPLVGNSAQSKRFQLQNAASLPAKKRVWMSLVKQKVTNQAHVLKSLDIDGYERLMSLSLQIRSGDSSNVEARAAQYYWPKLMGREFRRRLDEPGINGMLNYGYAIVRSCMARSIVGSGLHPTLGVGHTNIHNSMCLVDDFMEPFRPLCDFLVFWLKSNGKTEVDTEVKASLSNMTAMDLPSAKGVTTLFTAMTDLALSFIRVISKEEDKLTFPEFPSLLLLSSAIFKNA